MPNFSSLARLEVPEKFVWWVVGGGVCKVIFMSNPTVVLRLGWGFDKKENLKNSKYTQNIFALPGVLKTVSLKSEFLQKVIVKDLIL